MTHDGVRQVDGPVTFSVSEPLTELRVRLVSGALHVVAAPAGSPTRIEVSELSGDPLQCRRQGGTLRLGYPDLSWRTFFGGVVGWWSRKRHAVVSIALPEDVVLSVGTVDADAVVSDLAADTDIRTVSGRLTLTGLTGAVSVDSPTGEVEAQGLHGSFRATTVSGEVTILDSAASPTRVKTVGGRVTADHTDPDGSLSVDTVAGDVAVRLPATADTTVETRSVSGALSSSFDALTIRRAPGHQQMSGVVGAGSGSLAVSTVSGAIAVIRGGAPAQGEPSRPPLVKEV